MVTTRKLSIKTNDTAIDQPNLIDVRWEICEIRTIVACIDKVQQLVVLMQ